jgi:hypothetical protein
VIPIQAFMPGALAEVLKNAPMSPEKVAFAWRIAVGPAMANVTTVELRDGVLHVAARDRTWQREVRRAAATILSRLANVLGDAVTRVDVTVPTTPGQWAGESGNGRRRR